MKVKVLGFCKKCIEDVETGEIEFTEPVCLTEVPIDDCDNVVVDTYNERTGDRYEELED